MQRKCLKRLNKKIIMTQIQKELLEATYIEVFINGYKNANTNTILKNAKVNKGSMYHYFRDKRALVLAMFEYKFMPIVADIYTKTLDNDYDSLIKLIKNTQLIVQKHGSMLVNLSLEISGLDEEFRIILNKIDKIRYDRFYAILDSIVSDKIIYHEDINRLSKFILSSIDGATIKYKTTQQISDFYDVVNELIEYLDRLRIETYE